MRSVSMPSGLNRLYAGKQGVVGRSSTRMTKLPNRAFGMSTQQAAVSTEKKVLRVSPYSSHVQKYSNIPKFEKVEITKETEILSAKMHFKRKVSAFQRNGLRGGSKKSIMGHLLNIYGSANQFHSMAAAAPAENNSNESISEVNALHTLYSKHAEQLKVPNVTHLALHMQRLSDSVKCGIFFKLTTDQQLDLFKPLSLSTLMQESGLVLSNTESAHLFELIFKTNYRLAASSRDIDVLRNIHEAIMAFSAFKDMSDEVNPVPKKQSDNNIEPPKEESPKEDPPKKDEDKKDEDKKDEDKKDEDKKDTEVVVEEKKLETTDSTTDPTDTTTTPADGAKKTEKLSLSEAMKSSRENPNLRHLDDKWDELMNNLDKKTQERINGKKRDSTHKDEENQETGENDRDPMEFAAKYKEYFKKALFIIVPLLLLLTLNSAVRTFQRQKNNYKEFVDKFLSQGLVERLDIDVNTVTAFLKENPEKTRVYIFDYVSRQVFEKNLRDDIAKSGVADIPLRVNMNPEHGIVPLLFGIVPTVVITGLMFYFFMQMKKNPGMMRDPFGSNKKFTVVKNVKTKFKDVAGMDEAKKEIVEFVDFLKNPERYSKLGANLPKGALLSGPPGTGKTLLARATAGEAGVNFYTVSGSEFLEMFVGVGASRVRELFKVARKNAPSIVFIDEIDAVARGRSKRGGMGGNDEREATLNQMLVEMDGFSSNEAVVVFAATNRPDMLDSALLRPGRFDRKIQVNEPDIQGRSEIFKVHLSKIVTSVDKNEVAAKLAALTPGMVGADIANVCNEAAIIAARHNKDAVEVIDFEAAVDRIIAGLEKQNKILTSEERRTVAYHEAGHAVLGWVLDHADPLLKVTIVPRSNGALGFAQYLPKESALLPTEALCDMICMALGGRAAEETFFQRITTGASDDIRKTSSIARSMVTRYGMTESLYNMCYENDSNESIYPSYSAETSKLIDEETRRIVNTQYKRALDLLRANEDKVKTLAEALLERETINHDGLVEILGPRRVQSDSYVKYLEAQRAAVRELSEKERLEQGEEVKKAQKEDEEMKKAEYDSTNKDSDSKQK